MPRKSKPVPRRSKKIAEDYAKKVRIEPAKPSRQDPGLDVEVSPDGRVPGQHDHGPAQRPKNEKYPKGGQS
jgi:hypothetical protein